LRAARSALPTTLDEFIKWYRAAGELRVFWLKPVRSIEVINSSSTSYAISATWVVRGRLRRAVISVSRSFAEALDLVRGRDVAIVLTPEGDPTVDYSLVSAEGILYFWDLSRLSLLKPNEDVVVRAFSSWGDSLAGDIAAVHRSSWGFYVPPRRGVHVVLVAYLSGQPVGAAYLNTANFNIDYGVHCARRYWRMRFGTRVLKEIVDLARGFGARYVSVVRVFRRVKGSGSDRRAVAFYRANKPRYTLRVFRVGGG